MFEFFKKHRVCKLYSIFRITTGISLTLLVMNQPNTTAVPLANATCSHKNYFLSIHWMIKAYFKKYLPYKDPAFLGMC